MTSAATVRATSSLMQLALPGLSDSASIDSQITISYIQSADLLLELESEFDLIAHYSAPVKDAVFRLDTNDPLETRNLVADHPERSLGYRKQIDRWIQQTQRPVNPAPSLRLAPTPLASRRCLSPS